MDAKTWLGSLDSSKLERGKLNVLWNYGKGSETLSHSLTFSKKSFGRHFLM